MITDHKLVKRAEKLAGDTKSDAHPDLVARVESFKRAQDGGSDLAVQAHAKALVDAAAVLGGPEPDTEDETPRRTAKKATGKRSRSRG